MDSTTNGMATLYGSVDVTAVFTDGRTETVKVRQLTVKQFPALLAMLDDELAQVDLYCGKDKGWSENLTPQSFEQIVIEGDKINADFFSRWLQRRMERQEKAMPGLVEGIKARLLTSLPSAPRSPSLPVGPERRSSGTQSLG